MSGQAAGVTGEESRIGVERIGHRGAPREFPENTLPAFQRAFERGATAVELDVHATVDGAVVVHHDPALSRTVKGHPGQAIAELTLKQLQTVELAQGIRIPTLEQVFAIVPKGGRVYVEIKGSGIEAMVARVLSGAKRDCAVHSFDHGTIARMRDLAPDIPRGILYDERTVDVSRALRDTGARDVWPMWRLIDRATVERVHGENGRVIAWTVNGRRSARALIELGVDGLCTDDVRLLDNIDD
jgi:glycerophosphoryl diester phosphodiesterase